MRFLQDLLISSGPNGEQQAVLTVDALKAMQTQFNEQATQMGFTDMDDLTFMNVCQVGTEGGMVSLEGTGFASCADITPENTFAMVDAMMKEDGIDLASYGVSSFNDLTEDTMFTAMDKQLKDAGLQGMEGVRSVDDLSSAKLIKIMEDNGVAVDEATKTQINENFDVVKEQVVVARQQVTDLALAAGLIEAENDGAYTVMATMAAAATAIVALAL